MSVLIRCIGLLVAFVLDDVPLGAAGAFADAEHGGPIHLALADHRIGLALGGNP